VYAHVQQEYVVITFNYVFNVNYSVNYNIIVMSKEMKLKSLF